MPKKKKVERTEKLLEDILITQLKIAGVKSETIRKIVGVNNNRVHGITKYIKGGK